MDYSHAEAKNDDIIIHGIRFFELAQTLDNGQAFRWRECSPVHFTGIAHGRRLDIVREGDCLILKNVCMHEFETVWKTYFDLTRNYGELRKIFADSPNSGNLCKAMDFSPGLRLLKQDVWETLISFILSQNSNIPRIKKMIESLCENFGEALPCGGFAFPTPKKLAALSESDLSPIKSGYRAAYIIDAARQTANGTFCPKTLSEPAAERTAAIEKSLIGIHGVGPKVAACVLLYGFGQIETYPVDVWIKRAMAIMYPAGFPQEIMQYSGIAQQFLFHYIRTADITGF
jgi:N-glycosylase/DNA lyase